MVSPAWLITSPMTPPISPNWPRIPPISWPRPLKLSPIILADCFALYVALSIPSMNAAEFTPNSTNKLPMFGITDFLCGERHYHRSIGLTRVTQAQRFAAAQTAGEPQSPDGALYFLGHAVPF